MSPVLMCTPSSIHLSELLLALASLHVLPTHREGAIGTQSPTHYWVFSGRGRTDENAEAFDSKKPKAILGLSLTTSNRHATVRAGEGAPWITTYPPAYPFPILLAYSLTAGYGLFHSVSDISTFLNMSQSCATHCVPALDCHSLLGSSFILFPPEEAITTLQTLELLGPDRRGVATQVWGLLGPTQSPCSLDGAHKHSAEHKPIGTQPPHAEKGRTQNPSLLYAQCQDHGGKTKMCQNTTACVPYGRACIACMV